MALLKYLLVNCIFFPNKSLLTNLARKNSEIAVRPLSFQVQYIYQKSAGSTTGQRPPYPHFAVASNRSPMEWGLSQPAINKIYAIYLLTLMTKLSHQSKKVNSSTRCGSWLPNFRQQFVSFYIHPSLIGPKQTNFIDRQPKQVLCHSLRLSNYTYVVFYLFIIIYLFPFPAYLRLSQVQEAQRPSGQQPQLLLQQPGHARPDLPLPCPWIPLLHLLTRLHIRRV